MNKMNVAAVALGFCALLFESTSLAQVKPPVKKATTEGTIFFSGEIVSPVSNKCLDVTDEGVRDGVPIQQWACARQPNQLWTVVDQGRGEYSIVNQRSKKALDVAEASNADGARLVQNDFENFDNQRWRLELTNSGSYQIINARSRKCIDLQEAKRDDGVKVQQWSCSGQPNQMWLFRK